MLSCFPSSHILSNIFIQNFFYLNLEYACVGAIKLGSREVAAPGRRGARGCPARLGGLVCTSHSSWGASANTGTQHLALSAVRAVGTPQRREMGI